MIFIGYTRAEAIDWVQETLGPVTPRNIAEDTFRSLVSEGVARIGKGMVVLTEEMEQEELRTRARNTIVKAAGQQAGRRRVGRVTGNTQHMRSHNRHNRLTDCSADISGRDCDDDSDDDCEIEDIDQCSEN